MRLQQWVGPGRLQPTFRGRQRGAETPVRGDARDPRPPASGWRRAGSRRSTGSPITPRAVAACWARPAISWTISASSSRRRPVRVLAQTAWPAAGRTPFPDSVAAQVEFADGSSGQVLYSAEGDPTWPKEQCTVFGAGFVAEDHQLSEAGGPPRTAYPDASLPRQGARRGNGAPGWRSSGARRSTRCHTSRPGRACCSPLPCSRRFSWAGASISARPPPTRNERPCAGMPTGCGRWVRWRWRITPASAGVAWWTPGGCPRESRLPLDVHRSATPGFHPRSAAPPVVREALRRDADAILRGPLAGVRRSRASGGRPAPLADRLPRRPRPGARRPPPSR